jgi:hypothetical protein
MEHHADDGLDDTSELAEWDGKAAAVINVAYTLAMLLKDPTVNGKQTLTTDGRTRVREEAHESLVVCLDALESIILAYAKCDEVQSLSAKYMNESKQTPTTAAAPARQDSN